MKIPEAQSIYRVNRQKLIDQTRALVRQRDAMTEKYERTGSVEFSEKAAILQLSIDETKEKFEQNQKVLDELMDQYAAVWNAEVARQQADAETGYAATMSKIMAVARRMASGDQVPYSDEKKLLEYDPDLYKIVKNAQMIQRMQKKEYKKYDSLWDEEEDQEKYDPQGKADNAEVLTELPDISVEPVGEAGGTGDV